MHFESVAEKHVLSLLEFERSNKAYFELSIAPREAAFYLKELGVICLLMSNEITRL